MLPYKVCSLFLSLFFLTCTLAVGQATIWWTGDGGDGNWSTAANWSGGVVPGLEDTVRLGYEGPGSEVADVAQTINVDVDSIINNLQVDGQGQRQVILSSDTDSYLAMAFGGFGALTIESTAESLPRRPSTGWLRTLRAMPCQR